jgi:hypothetical protein
VLGSRATLAGMDVDSTEVPPLRCASVGNSTYPTAAASLARLPSFDWLRMAFWELAGSFPKGEILHPNAGPRRTTPLPEFPNFELNPHLFLFYTHHISVSGQETPGTGMTADVNGSEA